MLEQTYKHINVNLVGEDGNAFAIIGRVQAAMRREGCAEEERKAMIEELIADDYNHLLNTVMEHFSTDGE